MVGIVENYDVTDFVFYCRPLRLVENHMRVVQNEPAKVPFHEVGKDRCYFGWLQLGFRKWRVLISFCLFSW